MSVLAAILLREPYTLLEGICGGISVVGVLLVTRPHFLFGASDDGDPDTASVDRALGFTQVGIATFLAALIFVLLRFLRGRTNPLFFVSYSGMVGAPIMLVFMAYDEGPEARRQQDRHSSVFLSYSGESANRLRFLRTYQLT